MNYIVYFFFFLREFISKKSLFEILQYLKQELECNDVIRKEVSSFVRVSITLSFTVVQHHKYTDERIKESKLIF